jgi:hypothetical protein
MPPGLPLLAWFVQSFKPLVKWAGGTLSTNTRRGLGDVERRTTSGQTLEDKWQRLHDDAAVAWQEPTGQSPYEGGEAQLKRIRKWSEFADDWHQFIDSLITTLAEHNAWSSAGPGILLLPIDDVDLQIQRTPELVRVLRTLHHPRLVFLLTGHQQLLAHVLQLQFDGQRAKLASRGPETWLGERHETKSLGHDLATKVIRPGLTFELKLLDLRHFTDWLLDVPSTLGGTPQRRDDLKSKLTDLRFRGLVQITHRTREDVTTQNIPDAPKDTFEDVVLRRLNLIFSAAAVDIPTGDESPEVREAIQNGNLRELSNACKGPSGRLELSNIPIESRVWAFPALTPEPVGRVIGVDRFIATRTTSENRSPVDGWLDLVASTRLLTGLWVQWRGLRGGGPLRSALTETDEPYPWPSQYFAEWAGASEEELQSFPDRIKRLRGLLEAEMRPVLNSSATQNRNSISRWFAIARAWIRHMLDEPSEAPLTATQEEDIRGLIDRVESLQDTDRRRRALAALVTICHPAYGMPNDLRTSILWHKALWTTTNEPSTPGLYNEVTDYLKHVGIINQETTQPGVLLMLIGRDIPQPNGLVVALPKEHAATPLRDTWSLFVAMVVMGTGAWLPAAISTQNGLPVVNEIGWYNPSFDPSEFRHVRRLLIKPHYGGSEPGYTTWSRSGVAGELIGLFALERGRFSDLVKTLSTMSNRTTASEFVRAVTEEIIRCSGSSAVSVIFNPSRLAPRQNQINIEVLADLGEVKATLVPINNEHRPDDLATSNGVTCPIWPMMWEFSIERASDLGLTDPVLIDALGAWCMALADLAGELSPAPTTRRNVSIQHVPYSWIINGDSPWPEPPLESFWEWDRLRIEMNIAFENSNLANTALFVSYYVEVVTRITLSAERSVSWNLMPRRVNQLWRNDALAVQSAFKRIPESQTQRERRVKLARWWRAIEQQGLYDVLGDEVRGLLQPVSSDAAELAPDETSPQANPDSTNAEQE